MWRTFRDRYHSLKRLHMKIRPVDYKSQGDDNIKQSLAVQKTNAGKSTMQSASASGRRTPTTTVTTCLAASGTAWTTCSPTRRAAGRLADQRGRSTSPGSPTKTIAGARPRTAGGPANKALFRGTSAAVRTSLCGTGKLLSLPSARKQRLFVNKFRSSEPAEGRMETRTRLLAGSKFRK